MRGLLALALVLPASLVAANDSMPVSVRFDGGPGSFAYECNDFDVDVGSTARAAVDACAAAHGLAVTYATYGEDCFLDSVEGQSGVTHDPSGLYLLGTYWMFRIDGLAPSVGLCGTTLAGGEAIAIDYEVVAGYFGAAPNPGTALWTASHLP